MTLPVPNMLAPLVDQMGRLIPPWNSFFQQLTQAAPNGVAVTGTSYSSNTRGNVFITSGTPTMTLTRGSLTITVTGQKIIPLSIGDKISFSGAYTAQFLGS